VETREGVGRETDTPRKTEIETCSVTQTEQEIETGIVTATETERTRNVEDQQGRFAGCACGCFEGEEWTLGMIGDWASGGGVAMGGFPDAIWMSRNHVNELNNPGRF
jgi:hypothetical protein